MVFVSRSTLVIIKLGLLDCMFCDVSVEDIHRMLQYFPLSCYSSTFRPIGSLWGRDGVVIISGHLGCTPGLLSELGITTSHTVAATFLVCKHETVLHSTAIKYSHDYLARCSANEALGRVVTLTFDHAPQRRHHSSSPAKGWHSVDAA